MKSVLNIYKLFKSLGIEQCESETLSVRIKLTNQIALILFCTAFPYIFIFQEVSTPFGLLVIPIITMFAVTLYLNKLKYYSAARFGLILSANLGALYYSSALGRAAGVQLLFFAFIGMPLVLFEITEHKQALLGTVIPILCLSFLEFSNHTFFSIVNLAPFYLRLVYLTAEIAVLVIIILYLRFYTLLIEKAQKERIHLLQEQEKSSKIAAELAGIQKTIVALKHELNSPLTAVLLGSQALERETRQDKVEKITKVIQEASQQMKRIMKKIDTLSEPKTTDYLYGVDMLDLS